MVKSKITGCCLHTVCLVSIVVLCEFRKLETGVRFPYKAPLFGSSETEQRIDKAQTLALIQPDDALVADREMHSPAKRSKWGSTPRQCSNFF